MVTVNCCVSSGVHLSCTHRHCDKYHVYYQYSIPEKHHLIWNRINMKSQEVWVFCFFLLLMILIDWVYVSLIKDLKEGGRVVRVAIENVITCNTSCVNSIEVDELISTSILVFLETNQITPWKLCCTSQWLMVLYVLQIISDYMYMDSSSFCW